MNYPEAIQFLHSLQMFGSTFGLDKTARLAACFGNPHLPGGGRPGLRFIHVAGTNGKGSVCAMLEAIYRRAGFKTGIYTSPHLVRFGERMKVNGRPLPDLELVRLAGKMRQILAENPDFHPSFFEVVTVMALIYFQEQVVDLVIWETGLGGRLDATNIVTPLASVITNVQLDHQQWLGHTLAEIACEKAGIIKPGVPVITGCEVDEPFLEIQKTAEFLGSPLFQVRQNGESFSKARNLTLSLKGRHQIHNAAVALKTVEVLQSRLPVNDDFIAQALSQVEWPGRFQILNRGNSTFVLDGAHNVDGSRTLVETFHTTFPGQKACLILGILDDKDWEQMVASLITIADEIRCVPVNSKRSLSAGKLQSKIIAEYPKVVASAHQSLREALPSSQEQKLVVIAGSLYLIGEALEILESASSSERALNEWAVRTTGHQGDKNMGTKK